MEYIKFIPNIEPEYNTNMLKSLFVFNAFNNAPTASTYIKGDKIIIKILRNKTPIEFILQKPFDYPNNFDYFQILCINEYSDMTSINEYTDKINIFIRASIVNLSLGFILEYMNSNKNIISEDLEVINLTSETSDDTNETVVDDDIDSKILIVEPDINIKTESEITDKENELLQEINTNTEFPINYLSRFYNGLQIIKSEEIELYKLKLKHIELLPKIMHFKFEILFNDILKLSKDFAAMIELRLKYESHTNLLPKLTIVNGLHHFIIEIPPTIFTYWWYKFDITINTNLDVNIVPYYPILNKNPLDFLASKNSRNPISEIIVEYLNLTKTLKRPLQEIVDEENLDTEYSIPLFNIMKFGIIDSTDSRKLLNTNITQFLKDTVTNVKKCSEKIKIIIPIFVKHGWTDGMNSKEYISDTISNLNIARYCENKEYYNILIMIIIFTWVDFKDTINLESLKFQYSSYLQLNPNKIDSFKNLLMLYSSINN